MKLVTKPADIPSSLNLLPEPRVLVPTMGALHQGHLSLIKRARDLAGKKGTVIVTIFVNPIQFDQTEDLENYPRTLNDDITLCRSCNVDLVFAPESNTMYHKDHSVTVTETSLSAKLCGATRPGHFNGVCTVVLKLLNLLHADIAVFGKKDYQQLAIIRRMVRDLNVPVIIEGVDTVRESSGLALSSRNSRLTKKQHRDAARIRRALLAAQNAHQSGEMSSDSLVNIARQEIESSTEATGIDYLNLLDAETLQPMDTVTSPAIIATAVFYGTVRLIDNIELRPQP